MRIVIAVAICFSILVGCDTADSTKLIEYVADGRAAQIDVAFIAPSGLPALSDTAFVSGDSTYSTGDTTYVLGVSPAWRYSFEADDGQDLYLRVSNRTDRNHISAIIYVNDDYFASDGSGDPFGIAQCGGKL